MLYVTNSIPYIMQVVGLVARFQEEPKETHVQASKWIFIYLKRTLDFGLWYPQGNYLTVIAYDDVDWAGSIDERRNMWSRLHIYLQIFFQGIPLSTLDKTWD